MRKGRMRDVSAVLAGLLAGLHEGDQVTTKGLVAEALEFVLEVERQVVGMVVLSGYPSPMYTKALTDWRCYTSKARTQSGQTRTECLWLSPNAQAKGVQQQLFEGGMKL